jgi:hypothetical protein
MMTLPFNMPTFSENLQITLYNYHNPKHDMVATINFKLSDVTKNPNRYGPNVAVWYHLYGAPILPAIGSSSVTAITESMNKGAREGVEYKGRLLLSLQHRLSICGPVFNFAPLINLFTGCPRIYSDRPVAKDLRNICYRLKVNTGFHNKHVIIGCRPAEQAKRSNCD